MKIPIIVIALVVLLTLLILNIFLINRVAQADEDVEFFKMKFETLQGDIDILTYDLITSRDSVRILNDELSKCNQ